MLNSFADGSAESATLPGMGLLAATHELVAELLQSSGYDVAILGSAGPKDLDLFVLSRNGDPHNVADTTLSFLPLVKELRARSGLEVIVRHEHRAFLPKSTPILHLLFYPSLVHLRQWELPSFLAYVHDRGVFLRGSREPLAEAYSDYRRRTTLSFNDLTAFHLSRYADLAVASLVYLSADAGFVPAHVLSENIFYALRFTITELLVSECLYTTPIGFWDWNELTAYLRTRSPRHEGLIHLLASHDAVQRTLSPNDLVHLGLGALRLVDNGLQALDDVVAPQSPSLGQMPL